MSLFNFSSSGVSFDVSHLSKVDLQSIALHLNTKLQGFGRISAVRNTTPVIELTAALMHFVEPNSKRLIVVDDCWREDGSIYDYVRYNFPDERFARHPNWLGIVIFTHVPVPSNIIPFARIE